MNLPLRVMAVAAATGRVGMVFLVGWELKYWDCSSAAAKTPESAALVMKDWIISCDAKIVVTEKDTEDSRKGEKTKFLIANMRKSAAKEGLLTMAVIRPREYKNKYIEAEVLAAKFPDLQLILPKRDKFYENEPRYTVIFEALALAEVAQQQGTIGLAAAMG